MKTAADYPNLKPFSVVNRETLQDYPADLSDHARYSAEALPAIWLKSGLKRARRRCSTRPRSSRLCSSPLALGYSLQTSSSLSSRVCQAIFLHLIGLISRSSYKRSRQPYLMLPTDHRVKSFVMSRQL